MSVEPVRDKKGVVFDGIVCHKCKTSSGRQGRQPQSAFVASRFPAECPAHDRDQRDSRYTEYL